MALRGLTLRLALLLRQVWPLRQALAQRGLKLEQVPVVSRLRPQQRVPAEWLHFLFWQKRLALSERLRPHASFG